MVYNETLLSIMSIQPSFRHEHDMIDIVCHIIHSCDFIWRIQLEQMGYIFSYKYPKPKDDNIRRYTIPASMHAHNYKE